MCFRFERLALTDGSRSCGLLTIAEQRGQKHHAEGQTGATPDHGPAAADAIESERRQKIANGEHPAMRYEHAVIILQEKEVT